MSFYTPPLDSAERRLLLAIAWELLLHLVRVAVTYATAALFPRFSEA